MQESRIFTKEMFDAFKLACTKVQKNFYRKIWKHHERSLLSYKAKSEHGLAIPLRKKNKKKPSAIGPSDWEAVDVAEGRRLPSESLGILHSFGPQEMVLWSGVSHQLSEKR